jgi:glycogen debranching enzyme
MTSRPWTFAEESPTASGNAIVTLVDGASFAICDRSGDICGQGASGFFVGDRRVLSTFVLRVDGSCIEPLALTLPSPFTANIVGRSLDHAILVRRELHVGRGLRADLQLRNLDASDRMVEVTVAVGTDLAEVFEVKEAQDGHPMVPASINGERLFLGASDSGDGAWIRPRPGGQLFEDGTVRWKVALAGRGEWSACLEVAAVRAGEEVEAQHRCGEPLIFSAPAQRQASWEQGLPRLKTDVPGLAQSFGRAGADLGALRIFDPAYPQESVVAAGAPWFMTLFGRDALLTSWMSLIIGPSLALSTVRILAQLQGTKEDAASEEQPGRILHEVRQEGRASLSFAAGSVYYGSADATPLFVMLVAELRRWGTPLSALRPLLSAVDAALGWMEGPGDPDGDGYIEYERQADTGLLNQGWKDSWDGISFADGRLPEAPIALAEVQAYAYGAWRAGGDLARASGENATAASRHARADQLKRQFNRDFWLPDRGAYALALDRAKRPVDSIASNMGHCLWTGIVDDNRTGDVANWLISPELFSGWGVRTLATSMARYNPLSYHNGSVWPHDTAICVAGLRRSGFVKEAAELSRGLLRASAASGGRLPELFAGLTPLELGVPVPYPASCSPQAWASASPLMLVRSLLGLEPDLPNRLLNLNPALPAEASELRLQGLILGGEHVTIDIDSQGVDVSGLPSGVARVATKPANSPR